MKILCPAHNDTNPSLHVYEDRAYCFTCGYSCPSDSIATPEELELLRREPTDIPEMVSYIESLPKVDVRGLKLHADSKGYFILWPDKSFYKQRLFEGKTRYIGPRGKRPPVLRLGIGKNCIVVEGEINALSLHEILLKNHVILSPGSATELPKMVNQLLTFDSIVVIVDKDIPGVAWGSQLKSELLKYKKRVQLVATEKDLNQTLQEGGKEAVSNWFKENVVLPGGVQID